MLHQWEYGTAVRVVRNVKNDGTYPGAAVGDLLVRRGSIGHVLDVGTFLQDQVIYTVHFTKEDRIVGCREDELIGATDPWQPSRFEFRERVLAARTLVVGADTLIAPGEHGEVIKVLRGTEDGVAYHVHFECLKGRIFQVPESALSSVSDPLVS